MANVYTDPNPIDEYEQSRKKINAELATRDLDAKFEAVRQKIDKEYNPPQVEEGEGSAVPKNELGIVQEEIKPPTDVFGNVMDTMSFLTSPLMALGDAALAPIANPANTGSLVGDAVANFKTSGKAILGALTPTFGEDKPELGKMAAENLGLSKELGTVLELATDPTIIGGLPAIKMAQRGLRLTEMQKLEGVSGVGIESAVDQGGIFERAIGEFFGTKLASDIQPGAAKQIADLAAQADAGDTKATKKLVNIVNKNKQFQQHAINLDDEDVIGRLDEIKEIIGDPEKAGISFAEVKGPVRKELLKASLDHSTKASRKTNINLSNTNSSEGVINLMDTMMDTFSADYKHLIKTQSNKETIEKAQHAQLADLFGKKVSAFTPEDSYAIRQATLSSATNLKNKLIIAGQPTATPLHKVEAGKALAMHRMIQAKALGVSSHAGRLLQAQGIKVGSDRDILRQAKEIADNFGEGDRELNRLIGTVSSNPFLDLSEINKITTKGVIKKTDDAFFELFSNAILSGPVTHAINIGSNGINALWQVPQTTAQGLSGYGRAIVGKGSVYDANTSMLEAQAKMAGIVGGFSDAVRLVGRSSKISYQAGTKNLQAQVNKTFGLSGNTKKVSKDAVRRLKDQQWDELGIHAQMRKTHELNSQRYEPKITSQNLGAKGILGSAINGFGSMIRIPGNLLLAEDKAFKLINYRMAINADAVRKARTAGEGLDLQSRKKLYNALRRNPNDSSIQEALDFADYNTFTNQLGQIGRQWATVAHQPGMRYLVPFFRTPTNIVKMGVRHSVLGHVFKDLKPALTKMNAAGDAARARIAMGTGLTSAIVSQIDMERMTGRIDESTAKGRFKVLTGQKPYSFKIGDSWISYEHIEPLRGILGLAVNYREAIDAMEVVDEKGMPTDQMNQLVTTILAPMLTTISDNYVLPQLGLAVNVMEGINSENSEYATTAVKRLVASAIVPAAMRQVTKEVDGTVRRAETVMDMMLQGVPGMSRTLPARKTIWGDDQTYTQYLNKDIASRMYTESLGQDKYDKLISDLEVNIPLERKSITINKIKLELTPEQTARHSSILGKGSDGNTPLKEILKGIIDDPSFKKSPKLHQRKLLESLFTRARANADSILFAEDKTLQDQFKTRREAFIRVLKQGN